MHIADNIKFLRKRVGLTQNELAVKIGKVPVTISDYEKGKSLPPLDVAHRISRFFNVTIDDLVNKDLRKEELLQEEGLGEDRASRLQAEFDSLQKLLHTQERLTTLQEQRLRELEREIREHAPALAKRLELGE